MCIQEKIDNWLGNGSEPPQASDCHCSCDGGGISWPFYTHKLQQSQALLSEPRTCTALGQAEEFATYFLKVLKLVVAFPVGLMTLFILYNSLMRTANSFIVINSPNS